MYRIEVQSADGDVLACATGEKDARLVYNGTYRVGDVIRLQAPASYWTIGIDQAVQAAQVYVPGGELVFHIPFGDAANGYAPQAFSGEIHTIWVGPQSDEQRRARYVVSCNPIDQRGLSDGYPHAVANVETRGEAQFWARNAIDGTRYNTRHGRWPFHSWGIGERRDAWLRIDFGRPVCIDEVALTLRADFPHDAWWRQGTIDMSDGSSLELTLEKTQEAQFFPIGEHTVNWIRLRDLIKVDDPSPFPALTQIEVFGYDPA